MKNSRGLLILVAVVVVVAAVLFVITRRAREPVAPAIGEPPKTVRFEARDVSVKAKGLAVGSGDVRATIHPDFTSWLVQLGCEEPQGCSGELQATLFYHGGGESRRLVMVGRFDVPTGATLRFEGMENARVVVDEVDRVELVVRQSLPRGAPTPEVID